MKRFFIHLFLFVLIFGLLYPLLLFVWSGCFKDQDMKPNLFFAPASYGHIYTRLKEADTTSRVDLLFLGSSHAYRGFNTAWFRSKGYACMNLGSSSQSHLQTAQLLHRYLPKWKPRCVVYEVYHPVFGLDGSESAIDLHSNSAPDLAGLAEAMLTCNVLAWNTYFFSLPYFGLNYDDTINEPRRMLDDMYLDGGYVEKEYHTFRKAKHRDTIVEMRWMQKQAFYYNLGTIRNAGIPLLLIQAPVTRALYRSYLNTDEIDNWLSEQGHYLNFNKMLNLDDSLHFYDPHHLNSLGVQVFNEALLGEIESAYEGGKVHRN